MKFSKSLRQRLSQSPVGMLRERLSRSPVPHAIAEDMELGRNAMAAKAKLAAEKVAEKGVKFTDNDLKRSAPWLKSVMISSPDSSGKKRRLKDRLPTPKLTLKPKEKTKGIRPAHLQKVMGIGQTNQVIAWKFKEPLKPESAASFPEALRSGSLPRNYPVPGGEQANGVKLKTSNSMREVKATTNDGSKMRTSHSLNDVRSSFQPPLKPPRTFHNRPPWRN